MPDTYIDSLLLGLAVALIHATLQLSVSVLTLLSGHSLGSKKAHGRLLRLNAGYMLGAFSTVSLLLLGLVSLQSLSSLTIDAQVAWSVAGLVAAMTGFLVVLTYYRKGKGTLLWIPRTSAEYLSSRAKKTRLSVEAFALGVMTVVTELPFAFASLLVAALLIHALPEEWHLGSVFLYSLIVSLPLIVITAMLGAGHRLSTVQRWREANKLFLQYSAGIGLVLVSLYLTVFYLMNGATV